MHADPTVPPPAPAPPARRCRLYWSSGTGNSRRAALWIADAMNSGGADVCVEEMGTRPVAAPGAEDLLGLCYPTHGFAPPWSVIRYAVRLPRGPGAAAFVVALRGAGWYLIGPLPGFAGLATWSIAAILLLKGYRLRGLTGLDMPSNWMSLHPGMNARHAAFWITRAERKARRFGARLIRGRRWIWTPFSLAELILGLLLAPLSAAYMLYGRFFLAKLFFANERCNGCGVCAQSCPRHAIVLTGRPVRPYWTYRCESCMRCVAWCPTYAVEASHSLAALIIAAFSFVPAGRFVFGSGGWGASMFSSLLRWGAGLVLLFAAYAVFQRLLRLRAFLFLAARSTLTRWYRRYREPTTLPRDLLRPGPL